MRNDYNKSQKALTVMSILVSLLINMKNILLTKFLLVNYARLLVFQEWSFIAIFKI